MMFTRMRLVAAGAVLVLAGALAFGIVLQGRSANAATRAIPIGQPMTGSMTFYNDAGFGACGTAVNAATEMLVAVSFQWWTTPNPNNDPLCQGISVEVTYNGKTITVPVKDKCPSCDATHIDLSQPAFAQLAPLSVGVVNGITWKAVPGAASYRIMRDGVSIRTTRSRSLTDKGLRPGTTHRYTVAAVDSAGVAGTSSAPVTATTARGG